MIVTYYGHSCFAVQAAGKTLLFDPFITPNDLAKDKVDVDAIQADAILVTHGHGDHLADAVRVAQRLDCPVIAPFEAAQWLAVGGVPEANTVPMNHGGANTFPFGRVKLTAAIHSSSFPDGGYAGNPCGFVVTTDEGRYYYSGDTALTYDMKLIGEDGPVAFAVLPIGDHFTMGAEDAVKAAKFVGTKDVMGVHYDTFPPIKIDHAAAQKTFANAGLTLHLPAIGTSIEL